MPVGRTATRGEVRAILMALAGVLATVAIGFFMLRLSRSGNVTVHLGSDTFDAGKVSRIAPEIADRGPALFSDVASGTRDLYVNHLGSTDDSGWVAFSAREAGASRDCYVEWVGTETQFRDRCSGTTYPPDGTGLEQFPVSVVSGRVVVDINRIGEKKPQGDSSTTSSIVYSGIPTTR